MNKLKYDIHVATEKVRREKGYLTRSERTKLQHMIDNPKKYITKDKPKLEHVKSIVSNIVELRKPCSPVESRENISQIIKELKDTLSTQKGYALSANQIGYNKCICYIRVPMQDKKTKQIKIKETIAINPKIVEKSRKVISRQEGCLSFPGVRVDTERCIFSIIQFEDAKREKHTVLAQDLESLIWQHEVDHLNGITIFDRKHKGRK